MIRNWNYCTTTTTAGTNELVKYMPIYQYSCTNCGHNIEALQKITDEPITICPNCGKETMSKLISLSNFQLKGDGWYKTTSNNKD